MVRRATPTELTDSERQLAKFFNSSNVGLAILDEKLRYSMLNPYLAASHRRSPESHLGKHVREILGDVARSVENALHHVLTTAESVVNCQVEGPLPTRQDGGRWIANYFPIPDSTGKVTQVGAVVVELGKNVQVLTKAVSSRSTDVVLRSWKDIAHYVGTCVKTVQRWEHAHGFPVRRVEPNKGAVVFALRNEVDEWLRRTTRIT
jgi:PAS domain-containing protein